MNIENLPGIGKNKWIRYHYDRKNNPKSDLSVFLTQSIKHELSFDEARLEVARDIFNSANGKDIYVGLSGGADSEIIARSFLEQKIPFTPVILDIFFYHMHANYSDTWWAKLWCRENNLTPLILTKTTTEILVENTLLVNKINARHLFPFTMVNLANYIKSLGGVFVSGQALFEYFPDDNLDYLHNINDSNAVNNITKPGWIMHEGDSYIDMLDPGYHPYNFLSWTPEIVYSIMKSKIMTENSEYNKYNLYNTKIRPKQSTGPDIVIHLIGEQQRLMRSKFGTTEIAYIGSHEQILKFLKEGNL